MKMCWICDYIIFAEFYQIFQVFTIKGLENVTILYFEGLETRNIDLVYWYTMILRIF